MISPALLLLAAALQEPRDTDPAYLEPVPSPQQLAFHYLEAHAVLHAGLDVFDASEPAAWNPPALEVESWLEAVSAAGISSVVLEVRDARGFCLWPSDHGELDVAASPWRGGQGDLVRELSEACERSGVRLGFAFGSVDAASLEGQVRELLSGYGAVFQLSFANDDGAVDWAGLAQLVADLSPETVLHHGGSPHVRRVGGLPGETCWGPTHDDVSSDGAADGTRWLVPQADADMPADLPALEQLMLDTIGRGANLALHLRLEDSGRMDPREAQLLADFGVLLQHTFDEDLARSARVFASNTRNKMGFYAPARVVDARADTFWATDDGTGRCFIDLELTFPELVDTIVLCEPVAYGQRVRSFRVQGKRDNLWKDVHIGTTIGVRLFLRIPPDLYQAFRLVIEDSRACPMIATFSLYASPPKVEVHADETVYMGATRVRFSTSNPRAKVRYTRDGSLPTEASTLYTQPLMVGESCTLTALAFAPSNPGLVPARVELRAYSAESLRAPEAEAPGGAGLNARAWRGAWSSLDEVDWTAAPDVQRELEAFDVVLEPGPHAQVTSGFVLVPRAGIFGFFARGEGATRIFIGDELLLDSDGTRERLGEIGLKAGWHPLRVERLGDAGASGLAVQWRGPALSKRPMLAEELGQR